MKRVFRVDFGNYGGELVIGKVTDEFVEYWKDKIKNGQMTHSDNSSKLVNHLRGLEWDDENIDNESPRLKKGDHIPPWNEIDDFEHFWAPYADGGFTVTEVTGLTDEEKYTEDSGEEFDPYGCIYSREAYFDGVLPEKSNNMSQEYIDKNYVPVLLVHTAEKGDFGCIFVETENGEDFDAEKFSYSVCENNYCEFIDKCFYDKKPHQIDTDFGSSSSSTSGDHAMVGYLDITCHDPTDKYTDEYLEKENYWEE
jgi:hypothetical protein